MEGCHVIIFVSPMRNPNFSSNTSRHYRRSNRSIIVCHSRRHRNSTIFNLLHHRPRCNIRTRDESRPIAVVRPPPSSATTASSSDHREHLQRTAALEATTIVNQCVPSRPCQHHLQAAQICNRAATPRATVSRHRHRLDSRRTTGSHHQLHGSTSIFPVTTILQHHFSPSRPHGTCTREHIASNTADLQLAGKRETTHHRED